LDSSVGVGIG